MGGVFFVGNIAFGGECGSPFPKIRNEANATTDRTESGQAIIAGLRYGQGLDKVVDVSEKIRRWLAVIPQGRNEPITTANVLVPRYVESMGADSKIIVIETIVEMQGGAGASKKPPIGSGPGEQGFYLQAGHPSTCRDRSEIRTVR